MKKLVVVLMAAAALTGCKDRVIWEDSGKVDSSVENREVWNSNGKLDSGSRTIWNDANGNPVIK
ncbi:MULTISPECIES: membrane lipoprotein lipid attachment site-containing protein [Marinobacter]|uniref:Uncharacterized protein n=1 Tax=Marinobacter profundi TaxID=2666256 RepID=A0A2G1UQ63_9GAMM|nr:MULTISPECIES: membrane lipoprotein lipid attachment site-containing protein [Marinobacter]MBD3656016.1 membrane lipoprotein lipid attachment site-containing protein [Marinobacter sp.]PHQ16603.1 hypothetical protein CLH61_01065 [Marinobacter profundi]